MDRLTRRKLGSLGCRMQSKLYRQLQKACSMVRLYEQQNVRRHVRLWLRQVPSTLFGKRAFAIPSGGRDHCVRRWLDGVVTTENLLQRERVHP
jgi:hypothetical protein